VRVLVACEFSGTVRDAFRAAGHYAMSCDILPSELPGLHYMGDIRDCLEDTIGWDLMVAHPPCTHLASSGARWWPEKRKEQAEALDFVRLLMAAPIERIAIENPVGAISTAIRKPEQIIQPWQFGFPEWKTTCLWLKGLPKLRPTSIVQPDGTVGGGKRPGRVSSRIHRMGPSKNRQRERSRTYAVIASAMAWQWGDYMIDEETRLEAECVAELN
jgi:site-specific DNA-cytosine methylase